MPDKNRTAILYIKGLRSILYYHKHQLDDAEKRALVGAIELLYDNDGGDCPYRISDFEWKKQIKLIIEL